ncbi:hypothetical protein PLICRDRAFT_313944 [Plicaturopsis crispa FD-325 SS-3]|nr:hypothetical protein PLICRDRAFT_313944 [Plicaturopsis crispa FD-325 SS-3]
METFSLSLCFSAYPVCLSISYIPVRPTHPPAHPSMSERPHPPPLLPPNAADKISELHLLVDKYSKAFPQHRPTSMPAPHIETVLLTGSTGNLGSHILKSLIEDRSIARIYALNRKDSRGAAGVSVRARQESGFEQRGVDSALAASEKVVFVEGDAASLSAQLREEVLRTVTCVIHNAWPTKFTSPLSAVEPMIQQTRALIDLALQSPHPTPPRFLFISSESVYKNWGDAVPAPATPLLDATYALGTGYSESKWITESVVLRAGEQTALRPAIVRVGQLCGGSGGTWVPNEWPTLMFVLSQVYGCLPRMKGEIGWVHSHVAGAAIVELRHTNKKVAHVVHPHTTDWSILISHFARTLNLPIVPWDDWISALQDPAGPQPRLAAQFLKITRLFGHIFLSRGGGEMNYPRLSLEGMGVGEAPTLFAAGPLGVGDVEEWVGYWRRVGVMGAVPGAGAAARL